MGREGGGGVITGSITCILFTDLTLGYNPKGLQVEGVTRCSWQHLTGLHYMYTCMYKSKQLTVNIVLQLQQLYDLAFMLH